MNLLYRLYMKGFPIQPLSPNSIELDTEVPKQQLPELELPTQEQYAELSTTISSDITKLIELKNYLQAKIIEDTLIKSQNFNPNS